MHPQILGDGLALSTPARHQDCLTPVAEAPIAGLLEDVFQLFLFHCRQLNPPHLCQPPLVRNLTRGYLRKDAMSSGACIRAALSLASRAATACCTRVPRCPSTIRQMRSRRGSLLES